MTKFQKNAAIALIIALTAAIGAALYEGKQARDARIEAQKLRTEQAPLAKQIADLQAALANMTSQLEGLLAENSRLKNNSNGLELLKLRGEVTRLRPLQDDVVALQKMLSQSSAVLAHWKTNELTDAGRATPIDALQSYIYSSLNTNAAKLQSGIVGDDLDPPTPEALQNFIKNQTDHPETLADTDTTGFKVLSQTWLASDKVRVELQITDADGVGMSGPFTLRNINGEWKLVVFNVRDAQGKVDMLDFMNKSSPR